MLNFDNSVTSFILQVCWGAWILLRRNKQAIAWRRSFSITSAPGGLWRNWTQRLGYANLMVQGIHSQCAKDPYCCIPQVLEGWYAQVKWLYPTVGLDIPVVLFAYAFDQHSHCMIHHCNLNVPQLAWLERSTKRHGPPKKFVVTGGTWKYSQCMSSFNEVMHYFAVIGAVSQRWIHP